MNSPNGQNRQSRPTAPQAAKRPANIPNGYSAPNGQARKPASPNNTRRPNNGGQVQRGAAGAQKPNGKKRGLFQFSNKKKPSNTKRPQNNSRPAVPSAGKPAPQRNAQPPRAQVNPKASAAAARAMNTKHSAPTRRKFRGGSYILYYLLAAVVVIIVLIVLANTVLFNCKEIEVRGLDRYIPEHIIEVSDIRKGDNLLHIDKTKAAEKIVSELAYVDAAEVEKSYPTKIIITVTEAEKWFCISEYGVNAVISRGGKILEKGVTDDLPVVTGYEAESLETGARLSSKVDGKRKIPEEILTAADKAGLTNIDSIDITDRYSIKMLVDGRVTFELGAATEIETKMLLARKLLDDKISPSENVTVLLNNPEVIAVRPNKPNETSEPAQSDDMSDNPENSTVNA